MTLTIRNTITRDDIQAGKYRTIYAARCTWRDPQGDHGFSSVEHDFEHEEDAIAMCESAPSGGHYVKFVVTPNLPHALPAYRLSSCALRCYEDGEWRAPNIHGG